MVRQRSCCLGVSHHSWLCRCKFPRTADALDTQDIPQSQRNGLSAACFQTQKSTCLDRLPNSLGMLNFSRQKKRSHSSTSYSVNSNATDFNSKVWTAETKDPHSSRFSECWTLCLCGRKSPEDGKATGGRPNVWGSMGHSKGF